MESRDNLSTNSAQETINSTPRMRTDSKQTFNSNETRVLQSTESLLSDDVSELAPSILERPSMRAMNNLYNLDSIFEQVRVVSDGGSVGDIPKQPLRRRDPFFVNHPGRILKDDSQQSDDESTLLPQPERQLSRSDLVVDPVAVRRRAVQSVAGGPGLGNAHALDGGNGVGLTLTK